MDELWPGFNEGLKLVCLEAVNNMANKLTKAAATDVAAEKEGSWFEYSPDGEQTFRIKLARAGNTNHQFVKLQEDLIRPHRAGAKDPRNIKIPPEIDRDIQRKLYSQTIVKDWAPDDVGEPFSVENCYKMFKEADDVLAWCIATAQNADNYRKVVVEEHAGN